MRANPVAFVDCRSPDPGFEPRKVTWWARTGQGVRIRALATALLVASGCATAAPASRSTTHTRADGETVTCVRPSDALLDTDEAEGLSAAFPSIVQTLLSDGPAATKVTDIHPMASTLDLVDVLAYRVCLAYGEGVLPTSAYQSWQGDVIPGLRRRARPS